MDEAGEVLRSLQEPGTAGEESRSVIGGVLTEQVAVTRAILG